MPIKVLIPTVLRREAGGQAAIEVNAGSVQEALAAVTAQCPDLALRLYEADGKLKHFVNVFLGEENIDVLQGLETTVKDGQEIAIVPAIAGGCKS